MKYTSLIITGILVLVVASYYFVDKEEADIVPENNLLPGEDKINDGEEASKPILGISFQKMIEREYGAPALTLGAVLETTGDYKKYAVTYKSDDLTISGVIYIPTAPAPAEGYPVLVTNHGHIDTSVYTTGRGLKREQGYFATRGYVVLHPDYRNHAGSSKTDDDPIQDRLGYITDVINAVESLKSSDLKINRNNVTLLGHSMGGGATLAAAIIKPTIANRIVLYAPVTVNYLDSYNRWQSRDSDRAKIVAAKYGLPDANPEFWAGLNGEPYYDRITVPIQIYHGTNDEDVPYEWSTTMRDDLQSKGKNVELITYEGEGHEFSFTWTRFMEGAIAFTKN
jgi:dipeptidyl aminopeptidase/acylaminoacyl peptidase